MIDDSARLSTWQEAVFAGVRERGTQSLLCRPWLPMTGHFRFVLYSGRKGQHVIHLSYTIDGVNGHRASLFS